MLSNLDREDRMRLMKFVCSFAWADLRIEARERTFVHKMMRSLKLDVDDTKQVERWLELPPRADEIDPNEIPREHRAIFLEAAKGMIGADGEVSEEERENLALLQQLLA